MLTLLLSLISAQLCSTSSAVDWLLRAPEEHAQVVDVCWTDHEEKVCGIELRNGLVSRRFVTSPAFGTVDWRINATASLGGEQSMFRAVVPEGYISLNGVSYAIGGLASSSTFRAYCNRSSFSEHLGLSPNSFKYVSHKISAPVAPFPWTPGTRHSMNASWPPKGRTLKVLMRADSSAPPSVQKLDLVVNYEIYDAVPLITKWITLSATSGGISMNLGNNAPLKHVVRGIEDDVVVDSVTVELFAAMPRFGAYFTHGSLAPGQDFGGSSSSATPMPLLDAKSDQAHSAGCSWHDDYAASSDPIPGCPQCRDEGAIEPVLNCSYTLGPGAHVNSVESFVSFRAILLATDSADVERRSLMRQRVTQLLAPHVTENPIFFHATDVSEKGFKNAVDQMVEVGFEMLIFSFGSGFQLETSNPLYLAKIKGQIDYAKQKGIEVGGYDLIVLDRGHGGYGGNVGDQWDAVKSDGSLGLDACFASGWFDKLHTYVDAFINATGLAMLETDGPYGGGSCASTKHSYHHGLEDSVYRQTQMQNQFYQEMRAKNVYVNQPDNFFFAGGSRSAMGYDEQQYSLPRIQDLSISRMGLYDDLYAHLPTQGWMFLPLDVYHAGGEAATFQGHNDAYEWALAQYLGAGTAACYRGAKLYVDGTPAGQDMKGRLKKWVSFYKRYRQVLIQPVVHLRRPDMQSWDGWMHVHPSGESTVGVAMIFNPTASALNVDVFLNLYYTGLDGDVDISINDGQSSLLKIGRDYGVSLNLHMAPGTVHTIVLNRPSVKISV